MWAHVADAISRVSLRTGGRAVDRDAQSLSVDWRLILGSASVILACGRFRSFAKSSGPAAESLAGRWLGNLDSNQD